MSSKYFVQIEFAIHIKEQPLYTSKILILQNFVKLFCPNEFVINDKNNFCKLQQHVKLDFTIAHGLLKYFNISGIWKMVSKKPFINSIII